MPRIKEYLSTTESQGPTRNPGPSTDIAGSFGRSLQGLGQAVEGVADVVYKREEQDEILNLNQKMAQAHVDWKKDLDDRVQRGELDIDGMNEEMQEYFGQMEGNLKTRGGQQYFRQQATNLQGNLIESAMASQAQLAATKAKASYQNGLNLQTSALISDPTAYDMVKSQQLSTIDELVRTGGLPADKAEELKLVTRKELATSAVQGWIDINPDAAKKDLMTGRWDTEFDGDTKNKLMGNIDQAIRAKEIERERQQKRFEELQKKEREKIQNDFLAKMNSGELSTDDILKSKLEPFGSGSKEQFLGMLEKANKGGIKTDPQVYQMTLQRIYLPDGDPSKLVDEGEINHLIASGQISLEDGRTLRREVQGDGTQAGELKKTMIGNLMKEANAKLAKPNAMGIVDPDGARSFANYSAFFYQNYEDQIKNGKTPAQLLTPDSPDYLGKYIVNFQKSASDIMKARANQFKPPQRIAIPGLTNAVPRLPGETIEQYRKRKENTNAQKPNPNSGGG